MSFFIDFSWFYYECIDFSGKNFYFTYSTDLDLAGLQNINKIIFNIFQEICSDSNFFDNLNSNKNKFHPVNEIEKRLRIGLIYKYYGKDDDWIQQNIIDCDYIYQLGIKDNKRRLFFILDRNNNIVKPLFIDLNHAIYRGIESNKYKYCLICNRTQQKCLEKSRKKDI